MKAETLQATAAELTQTADKVRQELRLDLRDAESRASQIVAGIENNIKLNRAVYFGAGAILVTIFLIGLLVGSALGRG
jgi:Flp pilus assembly protein TadB